MLMLVCRLSEIMYSRLQQRVCSRKTYTMYKSEDKFVSWLSNLLSMIEVRCKLHDVVVAAVSFGTEQYTHYCTLFVFFIN